MALSTPRPCQDLSGVRLHRTQRSVHAAGRVHSASDTLNNTEHWRAMLVPSLAPHVKEKDAPAGHLVPVH